MDNVFPWKTPSISIRRRYQRLEIIGIKNGKKPFIAPKAGVVRKAATDSASSVTTITDVPVGAAAAGAGVRPEKSIWGR